MFYSCSLHVASGCPSQPSFLFFTLSSPKTRTLNVILTSVIQYWINSISQFVSGLFSLEMKWEHFIPTVFKSPGAQVELSLAFGMPLGSTGNSRSCISQSKTISEWILQHLPAAMLLSPQKQSSPAPCLWQDITPYHRWLVHVEEITQARPKAWQGPSLPEGLRSPTKNQHLGLEGRCGKRLRKVNVIDQDNALYNYKSHTNYYRDGNLSHTPWKCVVWLLLRSLDASV